MKTRISDRRVEELLYQALETKRRGIRIYERAARAVHNSALQAELGHSLHETRRHERILIDIFNALELDTEQTSPGREAVAAFGKSLADAIDEVIENADATTAEIVACECVVLAETRDHAIWDLIGRIAEDDDDGSDRALMLKAAFELTEREEDHHLYHTRRWCRELWLQSLGLPAELPPPEEARKVESAMDATRAEHSREAVQHQH